MEEKVLMEGVANPITHGMALQNGKGVLTNKRFIYCKHKLLKTITIGLLINLTKGDFEYDIPLETIEKFEIESKGIRGNYLCIYIKDGTMRKYGILKALDWEIAFKNALSGSNEATTNEVSTGKKFCTNCGTELTENVKFCGNCGTKL